MAQNSKKDQIAHAALPLFLEFGFKGSSVDMVVKNAGVSKPTVYNHFPDKAALLCYVLQVWLRDRPAPRLAAATLDEQKRSLSRRLSTTRSMAMTPGSLRDSCYV